MNQPIACTFLPLRLNSVSSTATSTGPRPGASNATTSSASASPRSSALQRAGDPGGLPGRARAGAAQDLLREHSEELGIDVMTFPRMVYVQERSYMPEHEVLPGCRALSLSGTQLRQRLADGQDLPGWFTAPSVAAELRRSYPRHANGTATGTRVAVPELH